AFFPVGIDRVSPAMDVRIGKAGIGRGAYGVVQPAVPAGNAAERVVTDRNFVHDQLGSAVHAVDFPDAVAVVTDVGAAGLCGIVEVVQGEGLEHAQTDVVLDQLAGLVEDLHVRLVDAGRRETERIAGN